jgi:hypothetical protein
VTRLTFSSSTSQKLFANPLTEVLRNGAQTPLAQSG